jgi:NAD(P)-dependent dehydrogenase (short-subunit alcohol dehydrogenase family)
VDRVAVVTGGGRGLGRAHADALMAAGFTVVVNDVDDMDGVDDVADLASVAAGRALVARVVARFDRLDVVVNNAGVSVRSPVADLDDERLEHHLGVHLKATIGTTAAALPVMAAQRWGRIINTVSGAGLDPQYPGSAAYATAKAAVHGFTRAAALEAPQGVTINAISPLAVTRMSEAYFARAEASARERLDPAYAARAVVWLASDDAADRNGRTYRVDGTDVREVT